MLGAQIGVNPGDLVEVWVWVGDANGRLTQWGQYGWYFLWNASQGTVSSTSAPLAAPFSGATAEWIMERPSEQIISYGFADFVYAEIHDAEAWDTNGWPHDLSSDPAEPFWLTNGSTALCTTQELGPRTVAFTWWGN
jgi:hypothetical protein